MWGKAKKGIVLNPEAKIYQKIVRTGLSPEKMDRIWKAKSGNLLYQCVMRFPDERFCLTGGIVMSKFCIGLAICLIVCVLPTKAISISFEEVDRKFGIDSNLTKLQKKEGWKKYKGECVTWTGELVYLDESMFGGYSLGFKHKDTTFTYDVLVSAPKSFKKQALAMTKESFYNYTIKLKNFAGVIVPITGDLGKCN